jgi:hypothetical protein
MARVSAAGAASAPPPLLVTLRGAAPRLGLSYWGARDLVLRGHLPAVRLTGKNGKDLRRLLIAVEDLMAEVKPRVKLAAVIGSRARQNR